MAYSLFETAELGPLISKNRDRAFRHQRAPLRSQWTDHSRLGGLPGGAGRGGVGIIITGHLSVDRDPAGR